MMNKEEKKEYQKQYYLDNKEKRDTYSKQWYQDNKEKQKVYRKQQYLDNREKTLEYNHQYRLDNKERALEYNHQYRLDNKERISEQKKQWYQDNKEKRKVYRKQWYENNKERVAQYQKERYHSDPLFKFKLNCRNRTVQAFKSKSWRKNGSTEKLLGCDWKIAMNHIESQFEPWMNWDNHGEWEIDHIIPLASANTKEEMIPLFNYKNLQPLLAEDNMRKGGRITKKKLWVYQRN